MRSEALATKRSHTCMLLSWLLLQYVSLSADPTASLAACVAEQPDFLPAHVLTAQLALLGTGLSPTDEVRAHIAAALLLAIRQK